MGNVKKYYNIKFPFTNNNNDGSFIDLNNTLDDEVLSNMLHVILTPKNTRIRMPDFGTDLIKFIFEMNDQSAWGSIKNEIYDTVQKYVPNVTINDISVLMNNEETLDDNKILLKIDYTVKTLYSNENNIVAIEI